MNAGRTLSQRRCVRVKTAPVHRLGTPSFADWSCEWRSTRVLGVARWTRGRSGSMPFHSFAKTCRIQQTSVLFSPAHLAPDRVSPDSQGSVGSAISRVGEDLRQGGFPFGALWDRLWLRFGKIEDNSVYTVHAPCNVNVCSVWRRCMGATGEVLLFRRPYQPRPRSTIKYTVDLEQSSTSSR